MKTNYKKKLSQLFVLSVLITSYLISSSESTNAGAWFSNGRLYSYNFQTAHAAYANTYNGPLSTFGCERETAVSRYLPPTGHQPISFVAYAEKCSSIR